MNVETIKAQQLQKIDADIHKLESDMDQADAGLVTAARNWATLAIDLGHALIKARNAVGYGHWKEWVGNNCSRSYRQCHKYVNMAEAYDNPEVNRDSLLECESLNDFRELLLPEGEKKGPAKYSPPWLTLIDSMDKWKDKFSTNANAIPPEGKDTLRQYLQPVVAQLWPEKFA